MQLIVRTAALCRSLLAAGLSNRPALFHSSLRRLSSLPFFIFFLLKNQQGVHDAPVGQRYEDSLLLSGLSATTRHAAKPVGPGVMARPMRDVSILKAVLIISGDHNGGTTDRRTALPAAGETNR